MHVVNDLLQVVGMVPALAGKGLIKMTLFHGHLTKDQDSTVHTIPHRAYHHLICHHLMEHQKNLQAIHCFSHLSYFRYITSTFEKRDSNLYIETREKMQTKKRLYETCHAETNRKVFVDGMTTFCY